MTRVIGAFKREHPNVSFVIHHKPENVQDTYDLVISDDLSFCKEYEPELLLSERIILATSREHWMVKMPKILGEDLSREGFVFMDEGSSLDRKSREICHSFGFEPHVVIRTDDPSLIRQYVSLGLGIALVPEFSWKNLFDETVSLRSLGEFRRDTYLFWKKNAYRTRTVRSFAAALRMQLEQETVVQ